MKSSGDEQIQAVIDDPRHFPISEHEQRAIWQTIQLGRNYGFGNLMAWLATAWAISLRDQGLSEETALQAVSNRGPYPLPKTK